jgi:hypothetical protein
MIVAVWLPILLPLFLWPVTRGRVALSVADRMPPRLVTWLTFLTTVGLAALGVVSLTLLVGDWLLQLPFVTRIGDLSAPFVHHHSPAARPVGLVAAGLLCLAVGRAWRVVLRDRRARRELRREAGAAGVVTILADEAPDAYTLPGQIVITTGMLAALSPEERPVVLAHERAHLAARHHRFLLLTEVAAVIHPALRPMRGVVAYGVERWADEEAAEAVGDRALTARAIGHAALASRPVAPRPAAVPGASAGVVPCRVAALLAEPRRPRRVAVVLVAMLALLAVSAAGTVDAVNDLHGRIEVAQQLD